MTLRRARSPRKRRRRRPRRARQLPARHRPLRERGSSRATDVDVWLWADSFTDRFAAAYAACFHGALKKVAAGTGADLSNSAVGAKVSIGKVDGGGFGLAVELEVVIPGVELAQRLVGDQTLAHVADEGGFDLNAYPNVTAWLARVAAQPGHVPITA